jgi:peptide/nickel transport system substrate-binding protein
MKKGLLFAGVILAGLGLCASPSYAQKSADTLRIAWRDAVPDVDPYYNSLRTGLILAHLAWDTLVDRDPTTFKIVPLLATSWKWIDPTTLEFTLRQGVKFQNGDPFTADDVVYTIATITAPDSKVSVPSNFTWIAGAEKIDAYHVVIKLKRIFPAALQYLAMVVPIYPKAYREKVGAAEYAKKPIGAGPYEITRVDGVTEIDLRRFDGYYAGSPKGMPKIGKIVIEEVPDATTELTSIIGGEADWIYQFSPDQYDNLKRVPTLSVTRAETMRVGFLSMDAAGRTGKDNPFTKLAVRQAVNYAIDRASIATNLVQGGSRVINAPCYPSQFGCDQAAATVYPYDPAKAKRLLAEAGYPNGFHTTLVTYILPQWAAALQNYLAAVGIRASIDQLQVGAEVQKVEAGQTPMNAGSWGSYSINDVSAILPYWFGGGPDDYARDPEVEKLVQLGGSTVDPAKRQAYYKQAIQRITAQAYWVPLNTYVDTYAFSKDLAFTPYPDELPRFYLSYWK